MGVSKKALRNKRKAEKRVGPKAKERVKKREKIEAGKKIKESKRKAAIAVAAASGRGRDCNTGGLLGEIDAVDELFANMDAEDDPEEGSDAGSGSDAVSDAGSDSSAGAFEDVGGSGDEDDFVDEAMGPTLAGSDDEDDAGVNHEQELLAIKEKDPEFYSFLVEQDKELLSFRAEPREKPPMADQQESEDEEEEGPEGPQAHEARELTRERFEQICASAKTSLTACKALVNAYHVAVKSIERGGPEEAGDGEEVQARKSKRPLLQITSEETFSLVLEWCVANILPILTQHAGKLQGGKGSKAGKAKKGGKDLAPQGSTAAAAAGAVDVTRYEKWNRLRFMAMLFWGETSRLLGHVSAPEMQEYVLRHCSTPLALSWLWPFGKQRDRLTHRSCVLWSSGRSEQVKLLAFLFLRNSGVMTMHLKEDRQRVRAQPPLDTLVRLVFRSFADVASRGYSWGAVSTFRFMENSLVELLRLDDATAYRVAYACIRQLAVILRNACVALSQGGKAKKKPRNDAKPTLPRKVREQQDQQAPGKPKPKAKARKQKQQQAQALVSWPFVRAIYFWTKAVAEVPALRPLAYPLTMVVLGAIKHRLTSLPHFPFVYHLLFSLNRLGASMEAFVPVSSHLLKLLSVLMQAMEKGRKKPKGGAGSDGGLAKSKAPEIEVLLRFGATQAAEPLALEAAGSAVLFLLTDHLGLLARSPAFPEVATPVLLHLRRHRKHCPSDALRRQLKSLADAAEASAAEVRSRRESLTEAPDWKKFLTFEADTAMAKSRAALLRTKAAEEKSRIDAEARERQKKPRRSQLEEAEGLVKGAEVGEEAAEAGGRAGKSRAQKRREAKAAEGKAAEATAQGQQAEAVRPSKAARAAMASAHPDAVHDDMLEEMGFSSGEEG